MMIIMIMTTREGERERSGRGKKQNGELAM